MSNLREAVEQSIRLMDRINTKGQFISENIIEAIRILKAALTLPEPVAWLKVIDTPGGWGKFVEAKPNEKGAKPVYTDPPQRKPLTEEEIIALAREVFERLVDERPAALQLAEGIARAVEKAHRIGGEE